MRLVPGAIFEGRDGSLFRYQTGNPTAAIVGLAASLRASGARLDDLRLKRPSLEDVYLQLVGSATHPTRWPPAPRCDMFLRSVLAIVRAQLIEIRRSKTAIFWMTAFPLGFLLLFGFVMARGDARVTAFLMPGLLTTTLLSGALFGVALPLVQQRETGLLRRLHVTPVPSAAVVVAHSVTALMTGFLSIVDADAARTERSSAMRWPAPGSHLRVCSPAAPARSFRWGCSSGAPRATSGRHPRFPISCSSRSCSCRVASLPFALLPDGVKQFARFLPTTYLVDTYSSVIVRGDGLMSIAGSLAVLLGVGAVGIVLNSMLFRWEGTDPIPRKSLALIATAFTLMLGVAAFAAPSFRMGELPGARRIEPGAAAGQVLVLRGATVLDGLGGRIVNARVTIREHRITDVSLDDARVPLPEGATVEDLSGRYLIPGLFDSHVHWGGSGGTGLAPVERTDDRMAHDFGATLAAGVTSVVSLTDDLATMRSLAAAVAAAEHRAPRTFFAGPSVTARGGHPASSLGSSQGLPSSSRGRWRTRRGSCSDRGTAIARGLNLVKLVLEPGFKDRPMPRLREEVFRAAMARSDGLGRCERPSTSAPMRTCGWPSMRAPMASSTPLAG